jgi:hypothetical protein
MATGKDMIQGYTGVATVDEKARIIVDAQAHGTGSEQELPQPVIKATAAPQSRHDGGLNKRLIYKTTLEQLNVLFNQYGASVKEDQLIKLLMELCAEQSEQSVDVGYLVMTY